MEILSLSSPTSGPWSRDAHHSFWADSNPFVRRAARGCAWPVLAGHGLVITITLGPLPRVVGEGAALHDGTPTTGSRRADPLASTRSGRPAAGGGAQADVSMLIRTRKRQPRDERRARPARSARRSASTRSQRAGRARCKAVHLQFKSGTTRARFFPEVLCRAGQDPPRERDTRPASTSDERHLCPTRASRASHTAPRSLAGRVRLDREPFGFFRRDCRHGPRAGCAIGLPPRSRHGDVELSRLDGPSANRCGRRHQRPAHAATAGPACRQWRQNSLAGARTSRGGGSDRVPYRHPLRGTPRARAACSRVAHAIVSTIADLAAQQHAARRLT